MITIFTVTSTPLLVNGYLVGEFGILITAGAASAQRWSAALVPNNMQGPR